MRNKISSCSLTFDVDWAPDWAVELCANICVKYGVPATFFITHRSPILIELEREPGLEMGIHPNFRANGFQELDQKKGLDFCLDIVPSAKAMRTHGLVQSTDLFALVTKEYQVIETDVSLYLPGHYGLQPISMYFKESKRSLCRLPYYWEDDMFAEQDGWQWDSAAPLSDGLRIFDFHPIHVALNTSSLEQYEQLKSHLGNRPLTDATKNDVERFRNCGTGCNTFLITILESIEAGQFQSISAITNNFRRNAQI